MKMTPALAREFVDDCMIGLPFPLIQKKFEMASIKAVDVALRKIAIGYPPAAHWFALTPDKIKRDDALFTFREAQMMRWWYDVQADFANVKLKEMLSTKKRTQEWERPTPAYLSNVLRRRRYVLRAFVSRNYLSGFVQLKNPIPEWQ